MAQKHELNEILSRVCYNEVSLRENFVRYNCRKFIRLSIYNGEQIKQVVSVRHLLQATFCLEMTNAYHAASVR